MTAPPGYTPEEWDVLKRLPIDAAMAVVHSGETGPIQVIREASALASAILQAADSPIGLIAAVAGDLQGAHRVLASGGDDDEIPDVERARRARADALEGIRRAREILAARATRSDAAGYLKWVLEVARRTAEASKEGGFLGFGGTRVTPEETATLDALAAALGIP